MYIKYRFCKKIIIVLENFLQNVLVIGQRFSNGGCIENSRDLELIQKNLTF